MKGYSIILTRLFFHVTSKMPLEKQFYLVFCVEWVYLERVKCKTAEVSTYDYGQYFVACFRILALPMCSVHWLLD